MSSAWGRSIIRIRWLVLAAAVVLVAVGATWGSAVYGELASGGFDDPNSESVRAPQRIAAELGRREPELVVLYSSETATVDDPAMREPITATISELRQRSEVAEIVSYYDTQAPELVSENRRATYATVSLSGASESERRESFKAIEEDLHAPGVDTHVGGHVPLFQVSEDMAVQDVARGEAIALPITLVLLVLIFGGLIAAGMPLLIGILAILGALTATRIITLFTDVSTFAVNTIILLGLGMAIDYSLLIISRFREELRAGFDPHQAVERTVATAGRTVLVSGLTIVLALASLLIFPQVFLRSTALGGMAAVGIAMLGALTVLPAALALLGHRINAWRVPVPWRRRDRGEVAEVSTDVHSGFWARLARSVMRRPVLYLTAVVLVLGVLALPALQLQFSGADERVMPAGTEARVASERIAAEFPGASDGPIETLITGASSDQIQQLVGQIDALPQVTGTQIAAAEGDSALVLVRYHGVRTGEQAYDAVRGIRDLTTPPGVEILVGGRSALDVDRLESLGSRLPWMALIMAGVTLILLFFAFGSVVLPIKAVLLNLVSIVASAGVVVWIFQEGHLSGLLNFTATGFLEPTIPILILVILFGLATDYEVFLISRIREEWDRTGDNTASVAAGLQYTGRIITAAAMLLLVVVAGFATSGISLTKMIGVGMVVAVIVDATLVRALLVPATLRLLGRWNWWAPGPLAKVYRRYGIRESATPEPSLVP